MKTQNKAYLKEIALDRIYPNPEQPRGCRLSQRGYERREALHQTWKVAGIPSPGISMRAA
jgi:hypothetical protein